MPDGCFPERRLSDPGFALEHECSGTSFHFADEGVKGGEFGLSADDLEKHAPSDRDRGREENNLARFGFISLGSVRRMSKREEAMAGSEPGN